MDTNCSQEPSAVTVRDPDDEGILADALNAHVHIFLSGDNDPEAGREERLRHRHPHFAVHGEGRIRFLSGLG